MRALSITSLPGIPAIRPGDDLGEIIWQSLGEADLALEDGDIMVVAQKVVSKAEGMVVSLDDVSISPEAQRLAQAVGKDPRLVEVILRESQEVLRAARHRLIVENRQGLICANAGVDHSNVSQRDGPQVSLLPEDPDASAEAIRRDLGQRSGKEVAVIISDSHGRPFREGCVGVAIGVAGLKPLWDRRGQTDLFGRRLISTQVALADLVASAALLAIGEADEGTPVALVRGAQYAPGPGSAKDLLRPKEEDLFR
ncbi:MAG: coenzyme F420-0:L-glutamate ligase [Dehalococcoidia bacterium]|nr:coenzyme F420-0:L-glutamate ligase [Dehalococcoidia bacterium]